MAAAPSGPREPYDSVKGITRRTAGFCLHPSLGGRYRRRNWVCREPAGAGSRCVFAAVGGRDNRVRELGGGRTLRLPPGGAARGLEYHLVLAGRTRRIPRAFGRLARGTTAGRAPLAAVGRRRDGTELALEITCSLVISGPATAMAVAIRADFHRRDADSGRREAVSLVDAALETTADGILVVSSEGEITVINDQYLKLWDMPPELLAAADPTDLVAFVSQQLVNPEFFAQKVAAVSADKMLQTHEVLEFRDGRSVEFYSRPQIVADTIVGRIWNFRDISARRRAQDQARRAMEELAEQADKLKELAFQDR